MHSNSHIWCMFVIGGFEILLSEGKTQGDSISTTIHTTQSYLSSNDN